MSYQCTSHKQSDLEQSFGAACTYFIIAKLPRGMCLSLDRYGAYRSGYRTKDQIIQELKLFPIASDEEKYPIHQLEAVK